jgi:hypothetical protein
MTLKTKKNIKEKENYLRQSWNLYRNVLDEHLEETIELFSDNELVETLELMYKLSLKATIRNCHFKMKTYLMRKKNFNEMTRAEKVSIIIPCLKKMTFVNDFIKIVVMDTFAKAAIYPFIEKKGDRANTKLVNASAKNLVNIIITSLLGYYVTISNSNDARIYHKIVDIFMKVYKRNNSEKNMEELVDVVETLKIELKRKNEVQQILMKEVNNIKTKKVNKRKTKQNKKQIRK